MEQQVWSGQHARPSTVRPRVAVSPPHGALQGHAAHAVEWSTTLSPKGSVGACTPKVFPHSSMPLARRTERRLSGVGSSAWLGC